MVTIEGGYLHLFYIRKSHVPVSTLILYIVQPKYVDLLKKQFLKWALVIRVSLKPFEISRGKGLVIVPGVVDRASNHMGKLAKEVKKARYQSMLSSN